MVLCDIDNFKAINDRYGHKTGDRVLKNVTNLLISYCNYGDIVCRYGGDEFLIIFRNSDESLIKRRMEVIKNIINKLHLNENITPMAFRRSFATNMLRDGVELQIIKKLMGHKSIVTTSGYIVYVTNETKIKSPLDKDI